ncbi:MAG TPA: hypothetical protein VHP33_34615 [Polyangiaceae bacterium]|nr:hypothetical protein [Polyangiaceae bacterium]
MASSGANKVATSQLALPQAPCQEDYANEGYEASVSNSSQVSLTSDRVFSDSSSQELASTSGGVESGFVAKLNVTI